MRLQISCNPDFTNNVITSVFQECSITVLQLGVVSRVVFFLGMVLIFMAVVCAHRF